MKDGWPEVGETIQYITPIVRHLVEILSIEYDQVWSTHKIKVNVLETEYKNTEHAREYTGISIWELQDTAMEYWVPYDTTITDIET